MHKYRDIRLDTGIVPEEEEELELSLTGEMEDMPEDGMTEDVEEAVVEEAAAEASEEPEAEELVTAEE